MMAENFYERDYEEGESIQEEGEKGIAFYLIVKGCVDVKKGKKNIAKLGYGQVLWRDVFA